MESNIQFSRGKIQTGDWLEYLTGLVPGAPSQMEEGVHVKAEGWGDLREADSGGDGEERGAFSWGEAGGLRLALTVALTQDPLIHGSKRERYQLKGTTNARERLSRKYMHDHNEPDRKISMSAARKTLS